MIVTPGSFITRNAWSNDDEKRLYLLTPSEFADLPDGIVLTCISGQKKTKGIDYIDQDTRFGMIAYGLTEDQFNLPENWQTA